MPERIFIRLLESSVQASFLILAILLVRLCFKRIPKHYICILWALLALRLLLPVQISSDFSLVPDTSRVQDLSWMTYTAEEGIIFSQEIMNDNVSANNVITAVNADDISSTNTTNTATANTDSNAPTTLNISRLLSCIWLAGTAILLGYGIISYIRTKLLLREAVYSEQNIWYSDCIPAPFVIGYVKPRIYIPFSVEKEQLPYIIAHEKSHIAHFDHYTKLLGYVLLCVYWFNPFIWVAFLYYCKDLELACDERVIQSLGFAEKKPYSQALLSCSISNKTLLQSPLAFSEVAIKERIMNILNYKKPEFWGILASIVVCSVVVLCFMTSSKPANEPENVAVETSETAISNVISSSEQQEEYNGFVLSKFDRGDGTFMYNYVYSNEAEDVSIYMNNDGLYSSIHHNGQKLEINTYGHFYNNGGAGYALPFLVDVTGDGSKDLVLEYASPRTDGTPYLIHKCFVYRLDTMERVTFNTDTAELSKLMIFTPKAFNPETNELTYQAEYDASIHQNLIPHDRIPWENTVTITPEYTEYWQKKQYSYIPNEYDSLYFDENKNCFVGEFLVYLDDTKSQSYYPFYVDYVWDEAWGSFIMDLSTARIPAAG